MKRFKNYLNVFWINGEKMNKKRFLGLDIGTKRIGVSISDPLFITAQPLKVIYRVSDEKAVEQIKEIIKEYDIETIVAGLPKNMDGSVGVQAQNCIDFMKEFSSVNVIFEDERLTSRQAEFILKEQGKKYTKQKQLVDIESACLILQQYMDKQP